MNFFSWPKTDSVIVVLLAGRIKANKFSLFGLENQTAFKKRWLSTFILANMIFFL